MKLSLTIFAILIIGKTSAISDVAGRVVFGQMMTLKELEKFNYQVAVHTTHYSGKLYIGGGSLIAPDVVLTAAHVVPKEVQFAKVVVGQTTNSRYVPEAIIITPDNIVLHENYTYPEKYNVVNPMHYDIALIFLSTPVVLSPVINTIPLAPGDFDCEDPDAKAWVSGNGGFGETTLAQNLSAFEKSQMRFAPATPFPWEQCYKIYTGLSVHRTQICSKIVPGKSGGICAGDSGGPYAFEDPKNPGKRVLCGIVSMGGNCETSPSGYISVQYFMDWICENSKGKVGCTK